MRKLTKRDNPEMGETFEYRGLILRTDPEPSTVWACNSCHFQQGSKKCNNAPMCANRVFTLVKKKGGKKLAKAVAMIHTLLLRHPTFTDADKATAKEAQDLLEELK